MLTVERKPSYSISFPSSGDLNLSLYPHECKFTWRHVNACVCSSKDKGIAAEDTDSQVVILSERLKLLAIMIICHGQKIIVSIFLNFCKAV